MRIEIDRDKLLPPVEAVEQATGVKRSRACVWRWMLSGKLQSWKLCGARLTTIAAVEQMLVAHLQQQSKASELTNSAADDYCKSEGI